MKLLEYLCCFFIKSHNRMANVLQLVTYICCVLIVINAMSVVVKMIIFLTSSTSRLHRHNDSSCNCLCELYATVQYARPFNRTVILPKSLLNRRTLARIGSDLDFDYNSCPPHSFMMDPTKQNCTPLHDDCPLLFIIGAHKAGTTSLYQYLNRHPNFRGIHVDKGPLSGETYHFTLRYKSESWKRYKLHFPSSSLTGEKSVGMFYTCEAPKWLYESCGRMSKVLVLLRNPTNRYISAMDSQQSWKILFQALLSDIESYNEAKQEFQKFGSHNTNCNQFYSAKNLYAGFYSLHLANWLCNFPSENILLLNSEEFRKSPGDILRLVLDFLHLKPFDDYKLNMVVNITYNDGMSRKETGNDVKLMDEVYKKLDTIYRAHNRELLKILHWNNGTVDWPTRVSKTP